MFELTKEHNLELRDSLETTMVQTNRIEEELNRRNQELALSRQEQVGDKRKIAELWTSNMHLTENTQRLSKEVDKGKEKKKELLEKHSACDTKAESLLGEAVAMIQSRDDEIATLKFEKQNIKWKIEDMLNPEEPEEDPEEEDPEEEQAQPDAAVGDGEIE